MRIKGFQKTSLIDYPGKICSIIFLPGCNFRCKYCYNPELVLDNSLQEIKEDEVFKILKGRKGFIDGVCITGGEPTLHAELPEFIKKIKSLGFLVKLDTNGSNPKMLEHMIRWNLIDFVAMDVKNSFEKYKETVNAEVSTDALKSSIRVITRSYIDHEFRTTVLPRFHKKEDLVNIARSLEGARKYFLQQFIAAEKMLDKSLIQEKKFSEKELEEIRRECNKYIRTEIRNL